MDVNNIDTSLHQDIVDSVVDSTASIPSKIISTTPTTSPSLWQSSENPIIVIAITTTTPNTPSMPQITTSTTTTTKPYTIGSEVTHDGPAPEINLLWCNNTTTNLLQSQKPTTTNNNTLDDIIPPNRLSSFASYLIRGGYIPGRKKMMEQQVQQPLEVVEDRSSVSLESKVVTKDFVRFPIPGQSEFVVEWGVSVERVDEEVIDQNGWRSSSTGAGDVKVLMVEGVVKKANWDTPMARVYKTKDWSQTPLGSAETWPPELQTTLANAIASTIPMNVIWGDDMHFLFNDTYAAIFFPHNPITFVGRPARDLRPLDFDTVVKPSISKAYEGESVFFKDLRVTVVNEMFVQESYFTSSLCPIVLKGGRVGGAFGVSVERWAKVLHCRKGKGASVGLVGKGVSGIQTPPTNDLDVECPRTASETSPTWKNMKEAMLSQPTTSSGFQCASASYDKPNSHQTTSTSTTTKPVITTMKRKDNPNSTSDAVNTSSNDQQKSLHTQRKRKLGQHHHLDLAGSQAEENVQEAVIDSFCHEIRNPLNGIVGNTEMIMDYTQQGLSLIYRGLPDGDALKMSQFRDECLVLMTNTIEAAKSIAICAEHQRMIADDVLESAKLRMSMITLRNEQFQPLKVVRYVLNIIRSDPQAKNIPIEITTDSPTSILSSDERVMVLGDASRLSQVLLNVLTHVVRRSGEFVTRHVMVCVELVEVDGSVSGHGGRGGFGGDGGGGGGFSSDTEDELDKVRINVVIKASNGFQFGEGGSSMRVSDKTHGEFGGSGLALSIAKQLVELMGGHMKEAYHTDRETLYEFSIPFERVVLSPLEEVSAVEPAPLRKVVRRKSNMMPPPSPVESVSAGSCSEGSDIVEGKKRLLVVDDNDINRKILLRHLTRHGYHLDEAVNGLEAVNLAKTHNYEMILMDIEMPVMNGLDATLEIRRWEMSEECEGRGIRRGQVPIVAVTGNARCEQVELYLRSGMQAVLVKPYTRDG
ncbi:hypothetical protein HDU76_012141, partial [Blyttiomyces sp. JEL0837]